MGRVGIGVIGVGFWGRNHARVLAELEDAKLVAVCDVDAAKAKGIGEKYRVHWYSQEEQLLKREDVDAVTICTPTTKHAEVALKAIEAGKHVLIEKPMASTAKEAREILTLAEKKNTLLMVGFIERFNPGVRRVKTLIEGGRIGNVVLAVARRVGQWPERVGDVGVVKDAAIHDLDMMRFMFGEEPLSVYARAGRLGHRYEDYAEILLSFSGIRTAFVEANWLTPHKVRTLTITGSKAIASVDYISQEITIEDAEKIVKPTHRWEEPLMLELKHFVECVAQNGKPMVSGLDGVRALEVAEAALKSAETGRVVSLM